MFVIKSPSGLGWVNSAVVMEKGQVPQLRYIRDHNTASNTILSKCKAFVGSRRTEARSLYILLEGSEVISGLDSYLIFSPLFDSFQLRK
jgi:hypothetical protein